MADELIIKNLHVSIEGKKILDGLNLTIVQGEVCAIMGPNLKCALLSMVTFKNAVAIFEK